MVYCTDCDATGDTLCSWFDPRSVPCDNKGCPVFGRGKRPLCGAARLREVSACSRVYRERKLGHVRRAAYVSSVPHDFASLPKSHKGTSRLVHSAQVLVNVWGLGHPDGPSNTVLLPRGIILPAPRRWLVLSSCHPYCRVPRLWVCAARRVCRYSGHSKHFRCGHNAAADFGVRFKIVIGCVWPPRIDLRYPCLVDLAPGSQIMHVQHNLALHHVCMVPAGSGG